MFPLAELLMREEESGRESGHHCALASFWELVFMIVVCCPDHCGADLHGIVSHMLIVGLRACHGISLPLFDLAALDQQEYFRAWSVRRWSCW